MSGRAALPLAAVALLSCAERPPTAHEPSRRVQEIVAVERAPAPRVQTGTRPDDLDALELQNRLDEADRLDTPAVLEPRAFAFNDAALTPSGLAAAGALAAAMRARGDAMRARITTCADFANDPRADLAWRRAEAVIGALQAAGVSPERLAVGDGGEAACRDTTALSAEFVGPPPVLPGGGPGDR